jgi:hypothetical protein
MAKLNTFVHVVAIDADGAQQAGTFGPADDLPGWAAAAITNPDVWDGEPPAAEPAPTSPPVPADPGETLVEPPRHGAGASTEAWRTYAEQLGWFEKIEDSASRNDIIAAVDEERANRAAAEQGKE